MFRKCAHINLVRLQWGLNFRLENIFFTDCLWIVYRLLIKECTNSDARSLFRAHMSPSSPSPFSLFLYFFFFYEELQPSVGKIPYNVV